MGGTAVQCWAHMGMLAYHLRARMSTSLRRTRARTNSQQRGSADEEQRQAGPRGRRAGDFRDRRLRARKLRVAAQHARRRDRAALQTRQHLRCGTLLIVKVTLMSSLHAVCMREHFRLHGGPSCWLRRI